MVSGRSYAPTFTQVKRGKGVWDESKVREAKDVRAEAKRRNEPVSFGRVCELLFVKNSEFAESDPTRIYKYRDVFFGYNVRDQDSNLAVFEELTSSPAAVEAARALDALSTPFLPGHSQEQSDATSAYTQPFLEGPATWVAFPNERWPKHWIGKYENPVVLLVSNLYGHPNAGSFVEATCETHVRECGLFCPCTGLLASNAEHAQPHIRLL